ncbi:hypothetical protein N5K37_15535 [Delftia tsuruhatensis]|uniref:hypothetical protein n=1 Tax=Delftia tsuruhatensis TaxID=180282 RepID=UPI000FF8882B|nr:hypothetical protein [Delftia tsuruhatensis]MDH2231313.1 hypothetical protein [Delftia tsuruhatensis]
MIQVTRKEFEKGWARARSVYQVSGVDGITNNAHRLMLFYAVENGLKALIMKIERIRDGNADFGDELHNINKLLDRAGAIKSLRIMDNIRIKNASGNTQRGCGVGDINQMWRYGCVASQPSDSEIEGDLKTVAIWIEEQLASN